MESEDDDSVVCIIRDEQILKDIQSDVAAIKDRWSQDIMTLKTDINAKLDDMVKTYTDIEHKLNQLTQKQELTQKRGPTVMKRISHLVSLKEVLIGAGMVTAAILFKKRSKS